MNEHQQNPDLAENQQTRSDLPMSLALLRTEIEAVDENLLVLFDQRMQLADQVARHKCISGRPVFDEVREDAIIHAVIQKTAAKHRLRAANLLRCLMRLSRGVQYELMLENDQIFSLGQSIEHSPQQWPEHLNIVCQGAPGSYSAMACRLLFPDRLFTQTRTFAEACQQVSQGESDVAVLPLENSTAGTVDDVYDLLLKYDLQIWRSVSLPIEHLLLGLPQSGLEHIHTVISHPQALAQCSDLISRNGWQIKESLNTAFAAEQVSRADDLGLAAIASRTAADTYHLKVIESSISNNMVNQTRFIAIGRQELITRDADRVSLILRLPHRSGALASTLSVFGDRELNLTKIQSRPDPKQPWTYLFYLDFEAVWQDLAAVQATLYQLSQEMPYLRFLGWYREMSCESQS